MKEWSKDRTKGNGGESRGQSQFGQGKQRSKDCLANFSHNGKRADEKGSEGPERKGKSQRGVPREGWGGQKRNLPRRNEPYSAVIYEGGKQRKPSVKWAQTIDG